MPIFVQLLGSPNEEVREQAAWALGNVAGDSVGCRDYVLDQGAMQALLQVCSTFTEHSRVSTIRNVTWTLSNLCRGKPVPALHLVSAALPLLQQLICSSDMEVRFWRSLAASSSLISSPARLLLTRFPSRLCPPKRP